MAAAWIEAHRKLDAGIPLTEAENAAADRSVVRFYLGVGAIGMLFFVAITAWGIRTFPEREAAFEADCKASGGIVKKSPLAMRCAK